MAVHRNTSIRNSLLKAILTTGLVIYLDVFVLGFCAFVVFPLAILVFSLCPDILTSIYHRNKDLLLEKSAKAALYAIAVVVTFVMVTEGNQLTKYRAEQLDMAATQYKTLHHKLPDQLQDLVPDFIPSIPKAKRSLLLNEFRYISSDKSHILMWMTVPPFGRRLYSFEENLWGTRH